MLQYPNIDPIAFKIGFIRVHWYGVMYLLGFSLAWLLALYRAKKSQGEWTAQHIADLIFYAALGVIVGGRLGYMLLYSNGQWLSDPVSILKIWQGGMSFHGGLLGVIVSLWVYAKRYKKAWGAVADFIAPLAPLGLAAGRLGNFINGELWGRVTDLPWGMVYPQAGPLPRHPSQLYEFIFEGVILFIILWCYSARPRKRFAVSTLFLLIYGSFRFVLEFFRQPDPQIGFIAGGWLTMGQLLSLPMIILVILLIYYIHKPRQ